MTINFIKMPINYGIVYGDGRPSIIPARVESRMGAPAIARRDAFSNHLHDGIVVLSEGIWD